MAPKSPVGVGFALALASAIAFATSGTFARSLLDAGWSAEAAVIIRVGVAAVVLALPAAWALRGRWQVVRRNLGGIGLFGLFAVAATQACFFNAVQYLPIGIALLLEYLAVILVVGWMWLVHGQRPRRLTVIGAAVAIGGLILVLNVLGGARLDPIGVLWGLGAAVGLAGYFVLAARIDPALPAVALASGGMAAGAAILAALGLIGLLPLTATFDQVEFAGHRTSWLLPVIGLALIAAVFAYVSGISATRILGARLASFVGLTEVLFAVLIAWLVLSELPTAVQLLGGLLIIGGVALVRLDELRTPGPPAPPAQTSDGQPVAALTSRTSEPSSPSTTR